MENNDFQKLIHLCERFERISARQIEIENLLHRVEMESDEEDLSFDDYEKEIKPEVEQERLDVEKLHQQVVTQKIVQENGRCNSITSCESVTDIVQQFNRTTTPDRHIYLFFQKQNDIYFFWLGDLTWR